MHPSWLELVCSCGRGSVSSGFCVEKEVYSHTCVGPPATHKCTVLHAFPAVKTSPRTPPSFWKSRACGNMVVRVGGGIAFHIVKLRSFYADITKWNTKRDMCLCVTSIKHCMPILITHYILVAMCVNFSACHACGDCCYF